MSTEQTNAPQADVANVNVPAPITELLLKADDLQNLDNYIQNLPTKYGVWFVGFFNTVAQKRRNDAALDSNTDTKK